MRIFVDHKMSPSPRARSGMVPGPTPAQFDVIEALEGVAGEAGATMAATALAWLRTQPGVASTLIGARSVQQLESNLTSLALELSPAQIGALDEVSTPELYFPAANHATLSPRLGFSRLTVDGVEVAPNPLLAPGHTIY